MRHYLLLSNLRAQSARGTHAPAIAQARTPMGKASRCLTPAPRPAPRGSSASSSIAGSKAPRRPLLLRRPLLPVHQPLRACVREITKREPSSPRTSIFHKVSRERMRLEE